MLKNYLKIAYKVLLRRKFFTFISLFAISFTLVVLTVATACFDYTFGPMAPETNLDRTVGVFGVKLLGKEYTVNSAAGYAVLDRCARDLPNAERTSFSTYPSTVDAYVNGDRLKFNLKRTDGQFWQILDFDFVEGAPFTDNDDRNGSFVAVINEATRNRYFGGGSAVGKTITLDQQSFRVVGVVRDVSMLRIVPFSDVWVPLTTAKSDAYKREFTGNMMATIVAKSASDIPGIKEEYEARVSRLESPDPKHVDRVVSHAGTFFEYLADQFLGSGESAGSRNLLFGILVGFMLLFMLLPTVNLVNINVSRILERSSEIGVRKAFGASSLTLVGQFLVENLAITLAGGLIGFLLSWIVLRWITASGFIQYADLQLNVRVFLYGLAIAASFGVLSGVYPAWRMSRLDPVQALKGGIR